MKRGFITLVAGVVCAFLSVAHLNPAWATVRNPGPAASRIDDDELKLRFLVAMARAREPQKAAMLERQRLSALQVVESETGLNLGVARMIEDAVARDPNIKMGKVSTNRGGISKHLREAKKLTFETAGQKMGSELKVNSQKVDLSSAKAAPAMQKAGFFLLAGALIDECRTDEPQANRAFLKHMVSQPWGDVQGQMLLTYLAAGMHRSGCITRAEFEAVYKPMVPAIRRRATDSEATPGTMAGTLFLLLATDEFKGITEDHLQAFVRAQSAEGTWADEVQKADASLFAALGAAVISRMLKSRGVKVGRDEITRAYANPPVLPGHDSQKLTP